MTAESDELFYLQDSRGCVGNDALWWATGGNGYTTDLRRAQVYTKAEAVRQHECRHTDILWPKTYVDEKTRPAVDVQYLNCDEALFGTGIELRKSVPVSMKRPAVNCLGCGRFISEGHVFGNGCPHCGTDNRP